MYKFSFTPFGSRDTYVPSDVIDLVTILAKKGMTDWYLLSFPTLVGGFL